MLLRGGFERERGPDTAACAFCPQRDVSLQADARCWWRFGGPSPTLVGWPAPFFPGCVRASRALRYLATGGFLLWNWQLLTPEENQRIWLLTAKEKGKTIIFFSFCFLSYPVGDIVCVWVTLITKALLRLPSSALRLKAEKKKIYIQFSKTHIFSLAGFGAGRCQASSIRPYTAVYSTSRLHESGFSV